MAIRTHRSLGGNSHPPLLPAHEHPDRLRTTPISRAYRNRESDSPSWRRFNVVARYATDSVANEERWGSSGNHASGDRNAKAARSHRARNRAPAYHRRSGSHRGSLMGVIVKWLFREIIWGREGYIRLRFLLANIAVSIGVGGGGAF